ncbi:MAG: cupin domain-containing protein [Patescibacteria group bacterium]
MAYRTHLIVETENNTNFRTVLHTGERTQLVVMDIPPGGDIGEESHAHVEQILFFASGEAQAIIDGEKSVLVAGDVLVVHPGERHNVINTGNESLKVYTVYAPPNHIDGRIHKTKHDAEGDREDEAFGGQVR